MIGLITFVPLGEQADQRLHHVEFSDEGLGNRQCDDRTEHFFV